MEPITPLTSHSVFGAANHGSSSCCSQPRQSGRRRQGFGSARLIRAHQNCTSPYLRQWLTSQDMGIHCWRVPNSSRYSMTTYSGFSSIGVSTPFLMKHRDIDDHREQSRGLPRPRGLLFLPLRLVLYRQAEKTEMVNTRPIPPQSRDTDLQTGVSRLALVPTRRSTSGLGTSGAAAPRNGAARVGSQARTARKAPPGRRLTPASAAQICHVPGLSDRNSKLGLHGSWLPTVYGMSGVDVMHW
ncbi:hypothetical protein B0T18DRAFT_48783 [Schizothecium vesticola]|uniref:Uncharacterized protein n=1 Tax=Schizothecium vesticola TaxID=314040 RepID=A0AA40FBU9_9PEZI|nr:hypothetical protein B0T18DRAFT_48783 [Schizothecium vesticola]